MNKKLFTYLFLFFSLALLGQKPSGTPEQIQKGEIFGQLKDSISKVPLEYAAITVYSKSNNQLVTGGVTNIHGKFSITDVPFGQYYITIQYVGYKVKTIPNIELKVKKPSKNLHTIVMVSDNALEEIVLDGSTPNISYDIDKKIIDVSNLEVDMGQSATEVLENVPSVTVDMDGTVNLRGSSSFTLLIDGRPTAMDASTALATIPATTIKNIEIITNPSAKYESEGVSGIMNIITKTNKLEGVSLLANINGGNYNNYSGDISVNVRKEKTEFNLGLDYRNRSRPNDNLNERLSDFDSATTMVRSRGLSDWGGNNYGINGEFTFMPNSGHTFSIGGRFNKRNRRSINDLYFQEFEDGVEVFNYFNNGLSRYDVASSSTYLNYRVNFKRDKAHYLEARFVYNYRYSDDVADIDFLDENGTKIGGRRNTEKGPSNMFRFNIDYSKLFKNGVSFEAGTQGQWGGNTDENRNYEYNPATGELELVPLFSANATYVRNIVGVYSLVKGKSNKLGYQLGLRAEYTDREITSLNFNQNTTINRLDWFPTVHLSYQLKNGNQLLVNYTRRIQRPRSYYLEPFITWRNAYSIYTGNSDLNPEYINAFEINWTKNLNQKGFVSVETYVRVVEDFISRVQAPLDTNIILTSPLNVGGTYSIGIEPSFSYKLYDWWKIDVAFNLFQYSIRSQHEQLMDSDNIIWNSRVTNTFPIKKTWNIQVASRYIGPSNTVQGRSLGYFTANGSIRKSFNSNQFTVLFQMRDIFSTIRRQSFSQAGNVETIDISEPRTPTFTIGFSMRLNNYRKTQRQIEADDF